MEIPIFWAWAMIISSFVIAFGVVFVWLWFMFKKKGGSKNGKKKLG